MSNVIEKIKDKVENVINKHDNNTNNTYDLGPMQINSIWLPQLASYWGVSERTALQEVRDDACINIGVSCAIDDRARAVTPVANTRSPSTDSSTPVSPIVAVARTTSGSAAASERTACSA